MKTCLVIIFNHRYEKNIERLRVLYADRFSCICFLMPFYEGTERDVIPVYESSYQFQGMVAQAKERLQAMGCDNYFFISDDLLLNPVINENNYMGELGLKNGEALCRGVFELQDSLWTVERICEGIEAFTTQSHTLYQNELMSKEEAVVRMVKYGFGNTAITRADHKKMAGWDLFRQKYGWRKVRQFKSIKELPYPLLGGYSDWFILPAEDFCIVSQKFGVTAAMGLFVEIAVPTVMFLYCGHIKRLRETKYKDGSIWDGALLEKLGSENKWVLANLFENFPQDQLYIHPVKLSKWK